LPVTFETTFTSFFKDQKSKKSQTVEIKVFLLFLLDDRKIRIQIQIQIRTNNDIPGSGRSKTYGSGSTTLVFIEASYNFNFCFWHNQAAEKLKNHRRMDRKYNLLDFKDFQEKPFIS
jgi:hypothetical protein